MPRVDEALISFGKLLGLFDAAGVLQWEWFGDPLDKSLSSMPPNRAEIGNLLRALMDHAQAAQDPIFMAGLNWEPLNLGSNIGVGFVWTAAGQLRLGIGAKANFPLAGQQLDLTVLARLLAIAASATPEIGNVVFGGKFPVPDFLSAGSLTGEVSPAGPNTVKLSATNSGNDTRELPFPDAELAWDIARMTLFVLRSWFTQRAAGGDTFFKRLDDHLFPMLGDPAGAIQPFPIVAPMQTPANFDVWKDSVLTTDNNASGALTFLWHLRALLTGNENPDFLTGSFFFPLVNGGAGGAAPTLANSVGPYQPGPNESGAWCGILTDVPNEFTLVIDLRDGDPAHATRIPVAQVTNGVLSRPPLDNSWTALVQALPAAGLPIGGGGAIRATADGISILRTTVNGSGFVGFDGVYELQLKLTVGDGAAFVLVTPAFSQELPPTGNPTVLLASLLPFVLKAAGAPGELGELVQSLADFVANILKASPADTVQLLTKVVAVAGTGAKIEAGPVTLELAGGKVLPGFEYGPIETGDLPIYIGKLKGGLVLDTASATILTGFTLGFENLRISSEGAGGGIIGSLIPDMRQFPGFRMQVTYDGTKVIVTGGGKVPIQRSLGPLEIAALMVELREKSFSFGLDLSFEMGPITATAFELGLRFRFDNGAIEPFLHGLGLGMDTSVIKLAGMFAAIEKDGVTDYVGGAVVSVVSFFELTAIGGYSQLPDGTTSLFIFAALIAPLGGPPWFFITGVAGGFGFNRSLPAPGLLLDHPFLRVMRGEIAIGKGAAKDLALLSVHFAALKGQHWIAAGIQFTAFGFINGKVVVAIGFGNHFSITILGMASFGIKGVYYFEIGIEATADEEKFLLRARISPNSYVIHPDIFSLQGDFALGVWYKEPHKGDFLLSVGGYHPLFKKPDHYPEMMRVGCKAIIYGFVHLSVEVFFACTPQALMAGAAVSLWAGFSGIKAGLDVYVDVLIRWDPFFLLARMGVCIWFEFLGRHEIGVDLQIWTPPFGGIATIDLWIVTFDVEFGSPQPDMPDAPLYQFISKQLGVPAREQNGGAALAAFNTETDAGLFRIEFLFGRPGKEPPPKTEKQEGIGTPVSLSPEFGFSVRTRLPLGTVDVGGTPPPSFTGEIDLPLCGKDNRKSTLTVSAVRINDTQRTWLADYFPAANFGEKLPKAQSDSRDAVRKIDASKASIPLVEGMQIEYRALTDSPEPTAIDPSVEQGEESLPNEIFPLPLGINPGGFARADLTGRYVFGTAANLAVSTAGTTNRRVSALNDMKAPSPRRFNVLSRFATMQRGTSLRAASPMTVAIANAGVPAGMVLIAPPSSPVRRSEMFGAQLRVVTPRSTVSLKRTKLEALSRPSKLAVKSLTPDGGIVITQQPFKTEFEVAAGQAAQFDLGGSVRRGLLRLTGDQSLRLLFFARNGDFLSGRYVRGGLNVEIPPSTSQVVAIGEGLTPTPTVNGIERDSVLLALDDRTFAAHGCVVHSNAPLGLDVRPLDSMPGTQMFDRLVNGTFQFRPVRGLGGLILKLKANSLKVKSALEEVRWLSNGASLIDLQAVIGAEECALVMNVRAETDWSLDIDLGPNWRLTGVVVTPQSGREMAAQLRGRADWDLIDDRLAPAPRGMTSKVSLEISQ